MLRNSFPLSDEQVAFYKENGYLQIKDFFTAEEAEHIKETMLRAMAKHRETMAANAPKLEGEISEEARKAAENYGKVFEQRVNLWQQDEEMKQITCNSGMAEVAAKLGGFDGVRLWHDQALVKPAGDSRPSNWHQDTVYWPHGKMGGLSIWIALDDVTPDNGCMWFVPKSRDMGPLEPIDLGNDETDVILKKYKLDNLPEPVCMEMPKGGVTFHDGLTFHYANANTTDNPRRAFVVIYMDHETPYNGNAHICTDGKGLEVGKPIAGEDFPLLYGVGAAAGA